MRGILPWFRGVWAGLVETAAPASCAQCDAPLPAGGERLCEPCARGLVAALGEAYCPACGRNVGPFEVVDGRCGRCMLERHRHDGLVRVGVYQGAVRRLVHRYKVAGDQRLDATLGWLVAAAIEGAPWREDLEAIVPVPSHWRRRQQRGFFPAGLLAASVAQRLKVSYAAVLRRPRPGQSQIGLSATQRRLNVRGQFVVDRHARLAGARVCLIDDVMVTGATVTENVRALKRAGAAAVYVAIIGKVDPAAAAQADV